MPGNLENGEFKKQNRQHAANMRAFLASGDLASFGSNANYVQKEISFDAIGEILFDYAGKFIKGFAEELDKADANASGAGTTSMRFEINRQGKAYEAAIFMNDYLKFVDLGVQGLGANNKNHTSPFKFRFVNPSSKHVDAIEKWIKEKNIRAIVTAPKGHLAKVLKPRSLAYVIAKKSKLNGLRATYFKQKTIDKLSADLRAEIIKATSEDITVNITL